MKLLLENWRGFLNEGGNIFAGQTASIPREFIHPTLERYYLELKRLFPLKRKSFGAFRPIGSVGKKEMSGDIDLAANASELFPGGEVTAEELKKWNIDPNDWQVTFDIFRKRARSRADSEIGWRAFLSELAKYINDNSDMIMVNLENIGPGIMFSLFPQFDSKGEQQDIGVQIDWMIGNRDWLEFAYYSDPPSKDDEFLKGLHRTQLMLAMFFTKGISYNHSVGLKDRKTKKLITNEPSEVVRLLGSIYGGRMGRETTNNFHSLHNWLKSNASTEEYDDAIGKYLKILDRTKGVSVRDNRTGETKGCGYIPKELEDIWIDRQEELGLTGKFLCRDTNETLWKISQRR
tara:strand:- start:4688 stop:5728 length:1041 start_codon:yes stop_codon:yes gene_type:complete